MRQPASRQIVALVLALTLAISSTPAAQALDGQRIDLPGLVYATIAQGANERNIPFGEAVKLNSSLENIIVSLKFAEDMYGRIVETRLYRLQDPDQQPARLAISAGWQKDTIMQTTPFIRPLNLERWPAGPYEARVYADGELLKVMRFELDDDIKPVPNTPREDIPVFNL